MTTQFRHDFRTRAIAKSLVQFEELIRQADLYDGDGLRNQWRARVAGSRRKRQEAAA